jgi:hypothetical protein
MPIKLRRIVLNKFIEQKEREEEAIEAARRKR